ncbi:MAG TPA: hypothetical protein VHT03_09435 [Rhizomicrobium sp.]|jgi:hypothetical protein|nr:hypothetical protein [Rhizomicrobium sp.]
MQAAAGTRVLFWCGLLIVLAIGALTGAVAAKAPAEQAGEMPE